ncbi:response regulator [Mycobacteroides chelonae]|uniref:response regulator n=1 Tax=Mycobacteroides chelonae TaxID=1774 RepID=UPI0004A9E86E|nr:response regulator [Mycobacteroides chelonae]MBF9315524.1 response regulator [Mycobacteroides chelonae]OHT74064.1 response regulator [Mycobacteroides chelonae]OHT76622.1 response regulator [Mycobacteroides chelonae]OHT91917.1 response regulator [Mycobacteroides chelonae]
MNETTIKVLIVDDDFRVANLHAGIVDAVPGFTVVSTANSIGAAHEVTRSTDVDLALVDVYLPDGSGIDFVRELRCDAMVLSAAVDGATIRQALIAGAASYLVKPFANASLVARLTAYARYRKILHSDALSPAEVDAALESLRPSVGVPRAAAAASPTKQIVLHAIRDARSPMSSAEVAVAVGISRATAQRYLASLVGSSELQMRLRYGTTGRPEQEFLIPGT